MPDSLGVSHYVYDRNGYFTMKGILASDAEPVEVRFDITGTGLVTITVEMEGVEGGSPLVKGQVIRRFKADA